MKLKELYNKYENDYVIEVHGRPLSKKTIPFSYLPYDRKELMNMEVVETSIWEHEDTIIGWSFPDMKPTKPKKIKGTISVYVRK